MSVNYRGNGLVQSQNKLMHNVQENVRMASLAEIAYVATGEEWQSMLRTKRKQVALLQELMARFFQPQDTVVDWHSGSFFIPAVSATVLGGLFRRFIRCDRDQECADFSVWRACWSPWCGTDAWTLCVSSLPARRACGFMSPWVHCNPGD